MTTTEQVRCWRVAPYRDQRDYMPLYCVRPRGHTGNCRFVRDRISVYSEPWHPCQTDPSVETTARHTVRERIGG